MTKRQAFVLDVIETDVAIIGAGGAGLRAAIEMARQSPSCQIALISKVYPMRSHTVAAEGGAAGVVREDDSLDNHFNDTVSGGDWLCDQDVVSYFVEHATEEMVQLEHWGCPWSRKADGHANVRRFGGMKIPRTWFAADKTGFHILHTLFQTSLQHPSIERFDEHFALDLLVDAAGTLRGVLAFDMQNGVARAFAAKSVIIATGGAGRVYQYNTNGGIVTGDGMALAYRHGVPLQDMEFVQYHPTGLPGSGILMTEGCRGEGGILINKQGYRYLQDYGLGPETPIGEPKNKYMELRRGIGCHRRFIMNGKRAMQLRRLVVRWCIWICAIWGRTLSMSGCRLFARWHKSLWALTQCKRPFLCARPLTTPWAGLRVMDVVKLRWRDCMR